MYRKVTVHFSFEMWRLGESFLFSSPIFKKREFTHWAIHIPSLSLCQNSFSSFFEERKGAESGTGQLLHSI